jgi:hypothetical protein
VARPAIGSEVYPTRIRARGTGFAGMCGIEEITAVELRKALEAR